MMKAFWVFVAVLAVYGVVGSMEVRDDLDVEYQASMSVAEARAWGIR